MQNNDYVCYIIYSMPTKFILSGLFLLYSLVSFSQDWDYSYTHYTKEDGLPSNTIYCVTSDRDGVLWLGTDAGVVRFDGFHMQIFNTDDGLPSNDVFEIVCDSKNRLWLTTFKNDIVYIFRGKVHTARNDTLIRKIPNRYSNPRYFEDSERNLWIRTVKFELFKIDKNDRIIIPNFSFRPGDIGYNITEYKKRVYFSSHLYSFYCDSGSNNIILLDSNHHIYAEGVAIFDKTMWYINSEKILSETSITNFEKGFIKPVSSFWNISKIDSNLWVPNQKGFLAFNIRRKKIIFKVLRDNQVSSCHKDSQGSIWISTLADGLFRLNSTHALAFSRPNVKFSSVCANDTVLLSGTNNGDFYHFNRYNLFLESINTFPAKSITSIRILKILKNDLRYFLEADKWIFEWDLKRPFKVWIESKLTSFKNFYFGGDTTTVLDSQGLLTYIKSKLVNKVVLLKRCYSYCEYKSKKVVGSQDSLYYIDGGFKPYPLDMNFNFRAVDLLVKDSLLIAITSEKGVFLIKDSTVVKNLNDSTGLSSNTCYKSVLYKDDLFIATNKGINIYNFKSDSVFYLFESDGLPSNTVFDLNICNDTIYAATEAGLSVIPVSEIPHRRVFPLFAKPIIANRDTIWDQPNEISVSHEKPITLFLNALSYGTKSPVRYFYKIYPRDSVYNTTTDPILHLTKLSYGKYIFSSYAVNSEGVKSNLLEIALDIRPLYYQTTFFKFSITLSIFIILFLIGFFVYKFTKANEMKRNRTEKQIRGLQFLAWKSAVNPHFLFNSLQSIQSLYAENKPHEAKLFTRNFSNVLRKTIDQSENVFITVKEEIEYLQSYLELESMKSLYKLDYRITVNTEDILAYFIPSMVIQIVVENCLKHGIVDHSQGLIEIKFEQKDQKIYCIITDNGKGFDENDLIKKGSKGISMIKSKLKIVEELIKQVIVFTFRTVKHPDDKIMGTETIFIFPPITKHYEVSFSDH